MLWMWDITLSLPSSKVERSSITFRFTPLEDFVLWRARKAWTMSFVCLTSSYTLKFDFSRCVWCDSCFRRAVFINPWINVAYCSGRILRFWQTSDSAVSMICAEFAENDLKASESKGGNWNNGMLGYFENKTAASCGRTFQRYLRRARK